MCKTRRIWRANLYIFYFKTPNTQLMTDEGVERISRITAIYLVNID